MSDKANRGGHASAEEFDKRLKRLDETRWIATRYADPEGRRILVALYLFNLELRSAALVSEPMIGAIRLQWWREALEEATNAHAVRRHEILIELDDAMTNSARGLNPLQRLVEAWEGRLDESQANHMNPETALAALAVGYLLPDALEPDSAATATRFFEAGRSERRALFRKMDQRAKPAFAHFAARDKNGEPTSGVRARWQVFTAMLLGTD